MKSKVIDLKGPMSGLAHVSGDCMPTQHCLNATMPCHALAAGQLTWLKSMCEGSVILSSDGAGIASASLNASSDMGSDGVEAHTVAAAKGGYSAGAAWGGSWPHCITDRT